ncbi:MAG: hypothetical protein KGN16_03295 [Burkholderiales bacterium]|nr:hypothetical protein [Burkholderiales bacterium]
MITSGSVRIAAYVRPRGTMALPLAAWPFLLLPFDSLTHLLGIGEETGAQTFPATAALSLVYLVLRGGDLRFSDISRKVFLYLAAVLAIMVALTAGHLALESAVSTHLTEDLRVPTMLRQGTSFVLGLSSFLMFQDALLRVGHRAAFRWMAVGFIPSFVAAPFQAFSGVFRVQGFSSEPSQFADALVFTFLPACFGAMLGRYQRRSLVALGVVTLLSTFSSTGIMKLGLVIACYYVGTGRALRGLLMLLGGLALLVGLLSLWPENYIYSTFSVLFYDWETSAAMLSITIVDRYMGLFGPLGMLNEPRAWLGLGLGADSVYFYQMFTPLIADAIRGVKWVLPSISSLQGKMLMYAGVGGYALYLMAWITAWRAAPRGHLARHLIPAIFLGSLFSLAPFFIPYAWLWLALGATASHLKAALIPPGGASR